MARYKLPGTNTIVDQYGKTDMSVFNEYTPGSQELKDYIGGLSDYQASETSSVANDETRSARYNADVNSINSMQEQQRSDALASLNAKLNAIDTRVNAKITEERQAEVGKLGQQRGLNVRGGLAGSNFASSANQGIKDTTNKNISTIKAAGRSDASVAQAELQTALNEIDDRAYTRLQNAETLDETTRVNNKTSALSNLTTMAKSGTGTWDDIVKSGVSKQLAEESGYSEDYLKLLYQTQQPGKTEIYKGFQNGNFVYITQDSLGKITTQTYSAEEMGIPEDDNADYKFTDPDENGNIWYYDSKNPNAGLKKVGQVATASSQFGTSQSGFEQFSQEQIALSVMPTQLRNSNAEREFLLKGIRAGLAQGLTPYQIADNLMGYKIDEDKKGEFSDNIRQLMAMDSNSTAQDASNYARLINSGNKEAVITKLEKSILKGTEGKEKESLSIYTKKFGDKAITEINNQLDKLGIVAGNWEKQKKKFTKSTEFQTLTSDLAGLTAEWRKSLVGTAVTESELKFINELIASVADNPYNAIAKIESLQNTNLYNANSVRSAYNLPVLNYDTLIDTKKRVGLYGAESSTESGGGSQEDPLNIRQ